MREMTNKEELMYHILETSPEARNDNYTAVRMWYKQAYNIDLPSLKNMESIWTIERMIRSLKSLYPSKLTDSVERAIKAKKEEEYKENALDLNKPIKVDKQGVLGLFAESEDSWW